MKEIYKDIPNYEGFYQVSNYGNVKSLERVVDHKKGGLQKVKGRILKSTVNSSGYKLVGLHKDGSCKIIYIHQLVSIVFHGHEPNGKTFICNHKDGNRLNNRYCNLEIVTPRENVSTCFRKNRDKVKSMHIGAFYRKDRDRWISSIRVDGKNRYLGYFKTAKEAGDAYQKELVNINKKIRLCQV